MSAEDLQSKDHRGLLDIIDQLRSQGLSKYIDLPEIIVCGDQSAGKSSVLEAISGGMSFPTKDSICTRFVTELVLRRDARTSVKVSINPGPDRDESEKKSLKNWRPACELGSDGTGLATVIDQAKQAMGLSSTKMFSDDTLRIELSGPAQPHLTMVDLPGLFRAANKEQSVDDADMVREMVARYMRRPRSIILAVVSAKNEYVLQDVTAMAKEADPEGVRTMGLITKPDMLSAGSETERLYVDVALNRDFELKLGWHVLRNRGYEQRNFSSAERDAMEEEFFREGIWATIESSHCGVKSLRSRLSSVLQQQISQQLPSLIEDVEDGIQDCNRRLERLGDARETPDQQRRYLLHLSQTFSTLMAAAVQGHYTHTFFGKNQRYDEKRLRAIVQSSLAGFSEAMHLQGESRVIVDSENEQPGNGRRVSRAKYIQEVVGQMKWSRGCELPGLFNPLIPSNLFVQQCQPWEGKVADLVEDVVHAVRQTTDRIIVYVAASDIVGPLKALLAAEIDQLKEGLDAMVKDLLEPHRSIHAITYNPQLTENVQKAQHARNKRAVEKKLRAIFPRISKDLNDSGNKITINSSQITELFINEIEPDMDVFGASVAVDYMQAYYKVALERFIDDIGVHAIERCLIAKLPEMFTPSTVYEFKESEITQLVGESPETSTERIKCWDKLKTLQTGMTSLKRLLRQQDGAATLAQRTLISSPKNKEESEESEEDDDTMEKNSERLGDEEQSEDEARGSSWGSRSPVAAPNGLEADPWAKPRARIRIASPGPYDSD